MATTSPDGLYSPNEDTPVDFVADWAASMSSVQTALTNRGVKTGTTAQRTAATGVRDGTLWYDTDTMSFWLFTSGAWTATGASDSGWVNITNLGGNASAGSPAPAYRRIGDEVYLRGTVHCTGRDVFDGWTALVMPAAVTPVESLLLVVAGSSATDGMRGFLSASTRALTVHAPKTGSSGYISLDGIRYLLG